ncbi:MAG: radical SAM/SPASM domain-containing protein [Chitinivibrionales bacterium]|nr:radical SAM/SPASM domain-containing protein [Chitinivibrionales bacterium]
MPKSPALKAEETLMRILNSDDVLKSLQLNRADLNDEVLALVKRNMQAAQANGTRELEDGFKSLALYIEKIMPPQSAPSPTLSGEKPVKIPKVIYINNTTHCNAKCSMCPTKYSKRTVQVMSMELFKKIITEIAPYKDAITNLYIGLHGEPFVDRLLEERVELCAEHGFRNVILTTNGSLVTEERATRLLAMGLSGIHFSLESLRPEVYEKIRVGLCHKVVLNNILNFIRLRDQQKAATAIWIRFIESDANTAEADAFLDYWRSKLNPRLDFTQRCDMHDWALGSPELTHPDLQAGDSPCVHVMEQTSIHCDGTMGLCCLDYNGEYELGNVCEHNFLEAYNSEKFKAVRLMHQTRQRCRLRRCCNCSLPEYWGGDKRYNGTVKKFVAAGAIQSEAIKFGQDFAVAHNLS